MIILTLVGRRFWVENKGPQRELRFSLWVFCICRLPYQTCDSTSTKVTTREGRE